MTNRSAIQSMNPSPVIRRATQHDVSFIVALHRRLSGSLGFMPTEALREHVDLQHVVIAEENGDPAAFIVHGALKPTLRIFQAAVHYDLQRRYLGSAILSDVAARAHACGVSAITLGCRDGLESNAFWSALRFDLRSVELGGAKRRKMVNRWQLDLCDRSAFSPGDSLTPARILRGRPALEHLQEERHASGEHLSRIVRVESL